MVATTRSAASARQPVRSRTKTKAKPKSPAGRNGRRGGPGRERARNGLTTLWGVLWAILLFSAAEGGPVAIAALMIVVAVIAGASGVRAAGGLAIGAPAGTPAAMASVPPYLGLAVAAAILVPAAALGGAIAAIIVGLLIVGLAAAVVLGSPGGVPYRTLLAAAAPTVAAASTVLAARQGLTELATLLVAVCLFDAANFLTGNGRTGWPIGSICGAVTVGVFAVMVAAVVVPPFSGHKPWILLGLVAGLAPAGVILSGKVNTRRLVPALRRLDSLVLAAPVWVIGVSLLLHR